MPVGWDPPQRAAQANCHQTQKKLKSKSAWAPKNDTLLTTPKAHKTKPHWLQNMLVCEFINQFDRVTHARVKN